MHELWNDLEPWSKTYYKGDDYGDTGVFVLDACLKECPGLQNVMKYHADKQPFKGVQISGCLHMTKETMTFARTLVALGAEVRWASSNPNSSNNQAIFTADKLYKGKVTLFGYKGESVPEYFWCMYQMLNWPDTSKPLLMVDDGCCSYNMIHHGKKLEDLYRTTGQLYDVNKLDVNDNDTKALFSFLNHLVQRKPDFFTKLVSRTVGLSEETTSGLTEMRKLLRNEGLLFPIFSTNDVVCKTKFDNNYGARYSSVDGMHRGMEGVLLGGRQVVVVGYGHVGKGVCLGFRGAGAIVKVCEADPICALQAVMDGFQVVLLEEMLETADIFVTATGSIEVIRLHHVKKMKDSAILGNIGQGDREILMHEILSDPNLVVTEVRKNVHYYFFKDTNKGVNILSYGRLYNLGCANGHPSFVMSMSFTTQFFALSQLLENKGKFDNTIHKMPKKLDEMVARYHLEAINAKLTVLTDRQCEFLGVNKEGPYKHEDYKY